MSKTRSAITAARAAVRAVEAAGRSSARDEAVVFLPGQLQVVPRHALVALPGVPEQEGGMKRRDDDAGPIRIRPAPELGDALLRPQERLRGEVPEGEDHDGLDGLDLGHEERVARRHLVGLGIAVALGPALHHVRDVAVPIAVEADAARREHPGEELARPADEGDALPVLLLAGALADDHEAGAGVAHPEDDGRPALAELAE